MGRVQSGVSTLHPRSNAQAKTEAVGGWQEGDRRRHEEALGALKRAEAAKTQQAAPKKTAVKKAVAKKTATTSTPAAAKTAS